MISGDSVISKECKRNGSTGSSQASKVVQNTATKKAIFSQKKRSRENKSTGKLKSKSCSMKKRRDNVATPLPLKQIQANPVPAAAIEKAKSTPSCNLDVVSMEFTCMTATQSLIPSSIKGAAVVPSTNKTKKVDTVSKTTVQSNKVNHNVSYEATVDGHHSSVEVIREHKGPLSTDTLIVDSMIIPSSSIATTVPFLTSSPLPKVSTPLIIKQAAPLTSSPLVVSDRKSLDEHFQHLNLTPILNSDTSSFAVINKSVALTTVEPTKNKLESCIVQTPGRQTNTRMSSLHISNTRNSFTCNESNRKRKKRKCMTLKVHHCRKLKKTKLSTTFKKTPVKSITGNIKQWYKKKSFNTTNTATDQTLPNFAVNRLNVVHNSQMQIPMDGTISKAVNSTTSSSRQDISLDSIPLCILVHDITSYDDVIPLGNGHISIDSNEDISFDCLLNRS